MFLICISYTAPLSDVDALLSEHVEWLTSHYASGDFIASGPQVPRSGGIILARFDTREECQKAIDTDPFRMVAEHELIEFTPTMMAPGYEALGAVP